MTRPTKKYLVLPDDPAVPLIADPLAEALHFLRMDGMFYCRSELTTPWGVLLPPMQDCLWFHVITAGECVLVDSNGDRHQARRGDVILLPHGAGHQAAEPAGTDTPLVFDLPHDYISRQYAVLRHGGGGDRTDLICGVVRFGHPAARSLIEMLPEVVHITGDQASSWRWFPGLLELMANETRSAQPGGEAVVTRLCDILVIQAIRAWIDTDPAARTGWLGALRDPQIGNAIAAIHGAPATDWTVALLAEHVAMSRSAFAARFTELVGEPVVQYLTKWRMYLAVDMLREDQLSISKVAEATGYLSEASFSRAFKRVMGYPPSKARATVPSMV